MKTTCVQWRSKSSKWSFKTGRFLGIEVFMHFTFILLISWVAFVHWRQGQSVGAAIAGVLFMLVIFFCHCLYEVSAI